jgi:hypothetical protein
LGGTVKQQLDVVVPLMDAMIHLSHWSIRLYEQVQRSGVRHLPGPQKLIDAAQAVLLVHLPAALYDLKR